MCQQEFKESVITVVYQVQLYPTRNLATALPMSISAVPVKSGSGKAPWDRLPSVTCIAVRFWNQHLLFLRKTTYIANSPACLHHMTM